MKGGWICRWLASSTVDRTKFELNWWKFSRATLWNCQFCDVVRLSVGQYFWRAPPPNIWSHFLCSTTWVRRRIVRNYILPNFNCVCVLQFYSRAEFHKNCEHFLRAKKSFVGIHHQHLFSPHIQIVRCCCCCCCCSTTFIFFCAVLTSFLCRRRQVITTTTTTNLLKWHAKTTLLRASFLHSKFFTSSYQIGGATSGQLLSSFVVTIFCIRTGFHYT